MRLYSHVESTRKKKFINEFGGEQQRRESILKVWYRWRKHNKVTVKATGQECVNWIDLAHDRTSSGLVWTWWWTFGFHKAQKLPECQFLKDTLPCCSVACSSTVSSVKPAKRHWLIWIGKDWEGTGHILVQGTVPSLWRDWWRTRKLSGWSVWLRRSNLWLWNASGRC